MQLFLHGALHDLKLTLNPPTQKITWQNSADNFSFQINIIYFLSSIFCRFKQSYKHRESTSKQTGLTDA
jgi:hypothetical protein